MAHLGELDFRAIFDAAPHPYLLLSPDFTITGVNDAYLLATLTAREAIVGAELFDAFPNNPDDPSAPVVASNLRASLNRVVERRVPDTMAIEKHDIRRPESRGGGFEERHWSLTNIPVLGAKGEVRCVLHCVEDVTEQVHHRTERDLAAGRLDRFFTLSLDMLCVAGVDGYFKRVSPAFRSLGYSEEELLARPFLELVHPDDRTSTLAEVEKLSRGIPTTHFENRYRCKDGSYRWLSWTAAPDPAGTLYGIARDVTEGKSIEEQLRRANVVAAAANQAKSRFLAGMSHELRTPLNAIIGFSELLEQELLGPLTQRQREYAKSILQSGRHLLSLINDVLDLSKIEAGRFNLSQEWTALGVVIDSVQGVVMPLADKQGVRLDLSVPSDLPDLYVDPVRLKQILYNLLSNAIKFTPGGGHVALSARANAESVSLVVSDTGIGIAREDLARLFREFEQIEPSSGVKIEGTGLGLALTRRLVELHGGSISVESEPGKGSTFTVALPRSRQTALTPSDKGPEALALVIEDDAAAAELIAGHLRGAGLSVSVARSSEDAFHLVNEVRPALITLDILMPGDDGFAILDRLKSTPATASIPVVVITVVDEPNRGLLLGAGAYLTKPIDGEVLLHTVEALGVPVFRVVGQKVLLVGAEPDLENLAVHLRRAGCDLRRAPQLAWSELSVMDSVDLVIVDLRDADRHARDVSVLLADETKPPVPVLAMVREDGSHLFDLPDSIFRLPGSDLAHPERVIRAMSAARETGHEGELSDPNTGLPSSKRLLAHLRSALGKAEREFKRVAIVVARAPRPRAPVAVPWADRLRPHVRAGDFLAWAGPAHVALVLPGAPPESERALAERFATALRTALEIEVAATRVVSFPSDGRSAEELLERCSAEWAGETST